MFQVVLLSIHVLCLRTYQRMGTQIDTEKIYKIIRSLIFSLQFLQ